MKLVIYLAITLCAIISCTATNKIQRFHKESIEIFDNKPAHEKIEVFEKNNVSYIAYTKINFGSRKTHQRCDCPELIETYILFRIGDNSYIQKFVGNAIYNPLKIQSNDILNSVIGYYNDLKNEILKEFETEKGENIFTAHSTQKSYRFGIEPESAVKISFSEEDFETKAFGEKNANYTYNKKLKIFKVDSLLNARVNELNKEDDLMFRTCIKDDNILVLKYYR